MTFIKHFSVVVLFLASCSGLSQTIFTGIVKDATTHEPIKNAKLYISGQGIGTISNEGGRFLYQKYPFILTDASQLTIWAKNYEPLILNGNELKKLQQKNATFLLEKSLENASKPNAIEQLTIFWDHSENQLEDTAQKLNVLNRMLKSSSFPTIQFIAFNNNIVLETNITNNDTTEINTLITQLTKQKKQGFSDATKLPKIESGTVLLIADNAPLFGGLTILPWVPIFSVVDYQTTVSQNYFEQISRISGGAALPLSKLTAKEINAYLEKKETPPLITSLLTKEVPQVVGRITNPDGTPIANATIQIAGKLKEYSSNQNGNFIIPARLGETLLFKALGKYSSSFVIEDTDTLRIEMTPKYTELEEVVVKNTLSQRYGYDSIRGIERINNRNYPIRDKITKEELEASYKTTVIDFLEQNYNYKTFFVPPLGKYITLTRDAPATWIVDGKEGSPYDVGSIKNIERISVYEARPSLSDVAPSKIIVTTKIALHLRDQQGRDKDTYALTKNVFNETLNPVETSIQNSRFDHFFKEANRSSWHKTYENLRKQHANDIDFYVQVSNILQKKDTVLAEKVRVDFTNIAAYNPKALKVLAFLYEALEDYTATEKIYRRMISLEPSAIENYRNLAASCAKTHNYLESFEWYLQLLNDETIQRSTRLTNTLTHELRNLIAHKKNKLPYQKLPNDWLASGFDFDTKIALEWNNPEAAFQVQFVNPNRRYFNISAPKEDVKGPLLIDFKIDKNDRGNWLINLKNNRAEDELAIPTYMKLTVYKNYGLANESRETKIIDMDMLQRKMNIYQLLY